MTSPDQWKKPTNLDNSYIFRIYFRAILSLNSVDEAQIQKRSLGPFEKYSEPQSTSHQLGWVQAIQSRLNSGVSSREVNLSKFLNSPHEVRAYTRT
jgi:hypothetical protein